MICDAKGIEHPLTTPTHSWNDGWVERTNRTIKNATMRRYNCDRHNQLRIHLADFVDACNFVR
jgi:hypothetical protein